MAGFHSTLHTRQSSIQSDKYQVSHKYSCFSWWWAHSRPKHVEKRNKHSEKNCAPSWLYLQENWPFFYRVVTYRVVTYRVVTYRVVTYRVVTYRVVTYRVVTYRVVTYRVVTYRVVTYRVVTYRVATYRVVTYRVVTYLHELTQRIPDVNKHWRLSFVV
jgi:U4/U6.U5 tri-snRNP-associated protein 1